MIKSNQQQQYNHQLNCDYICNTQMDSALPLPPPAMPESLLSLYQSSFCDPNKADSGLTYNLPLQRKRSRDFTTELTSLPPRHKNKISPQPSFLTQEILYHFQHQQSEIDRVLAHHVINSPPLNAFFFILLQMETIHLSPWFPAPTFPHIQYSKPKLWWLPFRNQIQESSDFRLHSHPMYECVENWIGSIQFNPAPFIKAIFKFWNFLHK